MDLELQREIDQAVQAVVDARREATDELVRTQEFYRGSTPFRCVRGIGAAWNFTMGDAFIYEGPHSIDKLNFLPIPVVVCASYIPEEELKRIDTSRVYGFLLEKGSIIDPTYWFYVDENRASVVGCKGLLSQVRAGESVIVDGVRGKGYLTPDSYTHANFERLRTLGPPQKDQLYWDALRTLTVVLMGSRKARKEEPPYAFSGQLRLLDIAKRARGGEEITDEDNEWMQALLLEGMPTPEEIMDRVKKGKEGGKKKRDEAPSRRKSRTPKGQGDTAKAKDEESGDAPMPDSGKKDAAKDDAGKKDPDPFAGLSRAARRRQERKKEIEEERKRRGKKGKDEE
ncbi:MAG: hypothetical protein ACYTFT_15850 [Planctomycetota bacterium]|jgi:hypothetical protein